MIPAATAQQSLCAMARKIRAARAMSRKMTEVKPKIDCQLDQRESQPTPAGPSMPIAWSGLSSGSKNGTILREHRSQPRHRARCRSTSDPQMPIRHIPARPPWPPCAPPPGGDRVKSDIGKEQLHHFRHREVRPEPPEQNNAGTAFLAGDAARGITGSDPVSAVLKARQMRKR